MRSWRAGALVFVASAAVLVLEIIAGRLMAPYVGVSLETFTGIIGTCLAGIAVGAAAGGRLADRRDPRRLVGPALVVGGVLTWASLPVVTGLGPALRDGPVAIVVLTAAAFGPAIVVLSAVAPMVAKLRLDRLEETGSVVGGLSAAGTLGALAGTFLTGFVAISLLPSRPIVLVSGAGLVVAGVVVSWRLGQGPRIDEFVVAALVGVGVLVTGTPCEYETAYFCVRVDERSEAPARRDLYLDRLLHASVDLDDPTWLGVRYVRVFADVVDTLPPRPLDVVHIGGGGFSFPRYLQAVRPGGTDHVLEIDGDLVDIAEQRLGLVRSDRLTVDVGDARLALRDLPTASADLVVGDAFGGEAVPWHLTTREVVRDIRRILRPDGRYVMNVIDGGDSRLARAQLATLADVFRHVAVVLPADGVPAGTPVNQVLVASDAPLAVPALDPSDGRWVGGAGLSRYVGDARVLTDDHAPVDQLILR
jgi:MFS family permease